MSSNNTRSSTQPSSSNPLSYPLPSSFPPQFPPLPPQQPSQSTTNDEEVIMNDGNLAPAQQQQQPSPQQPSFPQPPPQFQQNSTVTEEKTTLSGNNLASAQQRQQTQFQSKPIVIDFKPTPFTVPDFVSSMYRAPGLKPQVSINVLPTEKFNEAEAQKVLKSSNSGLPQHPQGASLPNGYAYFFVAERGWVVINAYTGKEEKGALSPHESLFDRILRERYPNLPLPQPQSQQQQQHSFQSDLPHRNYSGQPRSPTPPLSMPGPRPSPPPQPYPPQPSPCSTFSGPQQYHQQPSQQKFNAEEDPFGIPFGWKEGSDNNRRPMYGNGYIRKNEYGFPAYKCVAEKYKVPPGWVYVTDQGRPFYAHKRTGYTTYDPPKYRILDADTFQFLAPGWKEIPGSQSTPPHYEKGNKKSDKYPFPKELGDPSQWVPPGWTKVNNNSNGSVTYVFRTGYTTTTKPEFNIIQANNSFN